MFLVEAMVQVVLVAVLLVTLRAWWRHPDSSHRDIVLAVAPLSILAAAEWFPTPPWWGFVSLALVLAMPLLYMGLVRHLFPTGAGPFVAALVAEAVAVAALVLVPERVVLDESLLVAVVAAPYLYTAAVCVGALRSHHGVARARLSWTAVSGTLFAALLTLRVFDVDLSAPIGLVVQVALAFAYVWAFATPRPVREAWRAVVFRRFVEQSRADADRPLGERLERLRDAAAACVEADAAVVVEQHPGGDAVVVAGDPLESGLAGRLLRAASGDATDDARVDGWTVVPLHAPDQPPRTLAVQMRRARLFPEEDDATLAALAAEIDDRFREAAYQDAQEQARAAAEELARFRSEYLRSVGHEIANPLTPIRIHTALLRQGIVDPGPALDGIDRCVTRIETMVRDVSAVARLQAPGFCLDRTRTDLRALVLESVSAYAPVAEAQGCRLDADLDAVEVPVDAARVRQVVDNLLSNAIKYSPDGGTIRVRLASSGDDVCLEVEDEGLGMDEEQLGALFTPYGRVHRNVAPKIGGTGMGLHIAQQLVHLHGGRITACSDGPGRGSCFTLRLSGGSTSAGGAPPAQR